MPDEGDGRSLRHNPTVAFSREGSHNQSPMINRQNPAIIWLRRDALILFLYLGLTLGLTWPLVANLGNNWLATRDPDTFVKLWDQWWLQRSLDTGQSLRYTTDLFYPVGLDLSYHSISWIVAPVGWLLTPLLGQIDAYNVTILWAVFSTAYAAYLLIHYLLHNRAAAFGGGFIYGFAPYLLSHAGGHPDLVHLASVPLAALLLLYTFQRNGRSHWAIGGTAVLIAASALTSLYIMVFALLTLGPIFIFVAWEGQRWRTGQFWQKALWIGGITAVLLTIRLWPIFSNLQTLGSMIEAKYAASVSQTDLRALVTPSQFNPIFAPFVEPISNRFIMNYKWPAYLGVIPLLLMFVALTRRPKWPEVALWFSTGLMFLMLALGPVLRFNGTLHENIVLPANFLVWFPPIRAVGRPDFFVLGLLLPLGILAAYGFDFLWQQAANSPRRKAWQAVLLLGLPLLIFEFWNGPFPGAYVKIHPFYLELAQQQEQFALIELPMGRQESKPYLFYQLFHQKPMVEGLSARTPEEAYRYIEANPLLHHWRQEIWLNCEEMGEELDTAVTQLIQDNFRYVILHNQGRTAHIQPYFLYDKPIVQDEQLTVYDLRDIAQRPFCPRSSSR